MPPGFCIVPANAQDRPMTVSADIIANYTSDRHFFQNLYLPKKPGPGGPYVYVKNHKAACTTVLTTLIAHHYAASGGDLDRIEIGNVHGFGHNTFRRARVMGLEKSLAALNAPATFRFTVLREPVSRTVSAYADKIRGSERQRRDLMRYLRRPEDAELSLSAFLDLMAQDEGARDLDRHWRPQRQEISYDAIAYDFIGDVAQLKPSLAHVVRRLFGEEQVRMQDTRETFGHRSSSREMVAGLSAADRRNLEAAYGADFEMYEAVRGRLAAIPGFA
jgi:hypothetical protein